MPPKQKRSAVKKKLKKELKKGCYSDALSFVGIQGVNDSHKM